MKKIISNEEIDTLVNSSICKKEDSLELMWSAALGIFNNVNWKDEILIICGTGNNAGDGYALACILFDHGYKTSIMIIEEKFTNSGKYYFDEAKKRNIKIIKYEEEYEIKNYSFIVDAIFGSGLKGELNNKYKEVIDKINQSHSFVVSIDINSGLNGDNGLGEHIVKSNKTISIGYLRYGHFLNEAKDYVGELVNCSIDIIEPTDSIYLLEENDIKSVINKRRNLSNKGDYGYVGILGGCANYPGAIRLANLGQNALYSGAGVSRIIIPDVISSIIYSNVLESTIFQIPSLDGYMMFDKGKVDSSLKGLSSLGIGVGWGLSNSNQEILKYILLNYQIPVVIDADGINNLCMIGLDILLQTKCKVILTPHLKEFSRMINKTIDDIKYDSVNLVKEFCEKYKVILLLKGPTTIIASEEKIYLVNKGCPGMATAGSGDVLTGILVGMLGYLKEDLCLITAIAAYINGEAGEYASKEYGDIGMVSSDTARAVSKVMYKITK